MLKLFFLLISILLFISLALYKLIISKHERTPKVSVYVSVVTGFLFFYILISILSMIFISGITNKIVFLFLGVTPFVIGKFATYKKENLYSWLQILTVLFGIFYVLLT